MFKKILIKICLLALILTLGISMPISIQARAGGGGSSGGSSSGGHSSSSSGYHSGYSSYRGNSIIGFLQYGFFVIIAAGGTISYIIYSRKAGLISIREMHRLKKEGYENWNYKKIESWVKEAYYRIQECWARCDVSYASEYLSENIQKEWQSKLEWMDINNEKPIQKNVKLLSAFPIDVHDEPGEGRDTMWYLIHGSMTDYYVDKNTGIFIRGNTSKKGFYEYWHFIYVNKQWVLDEIKQKEEMDIKQFSL